MITAGFLVLAPADDLASPAPRTWPARMGKLRGRGLHARIPKQRYTFWSGLLRRLFPFALLLRHRPDAGAALHRRRRAARGPARPGVQRPASRSRCSSASSCSARWCSSSTNSSPTRHSSSTSRAEWHAPRARPERRGPSARWRSGTRPSTPRSRRKSAAWREAAEPAGDPHRRSRRPRSARGRAKAATDAVREGGARDTLPPPRPRAKIRPATPITSSLVSLSTQLPHGDRRFARRRDDRLGRPRLQGRRAQRPWHHQHHRPLAGTSARSPRTTRRRNIRVAKWFTAFWGVFAIGFALFAEFRGEPHRGASTSSRLDLLRHRCSACSSWPSSSGKSAAQRYSGARVAAQLLVLRRSTSSSRTSSPISGYNLDRLRRVHGLSALILQTFLPKPQTS
jgi:hypothetical protein